MEIESGSFQANIAETMTEMYQHSLNSAQSTKSREHLLNFVSGAIAGVATLTVGHPFDTVKVRMQMLNTSFTSCFQDIVRKEGYSALFKGFTSPLLTTPLLRACIWMSFETGIMFQGAKFDHTLTPMEAAKAGVFTAVTTGIISTPVDLIKCRMQMAGVGVKVKRDGSIQVGVKIVREFGIKGLYKGYLMTMSRDIPAIAMSAGAYQVLKRKLHNFWGEKSYNSFIAGAIAGAFVGTVSYPQDLVKTRIQNGKGDALQVIKDVFRKDGFKGFWRGFGASITRAPLAVAVSYWSYDRTKETLSKLILH